MPNIKSVLQYQCQRNVSSNDDANTIMDIAIDKIPALIANALDHCDALRCATMPYSILVIPIKSKPIAKGRIKNPAVQSEKETTMIPNTIVKPP